MADKTKVGIWDLPIFADGLAAWFSRHEDFACLWTTQENPFRSMMTHPIDFLIIGNEVSHVIIDVLKEIQQKIKLPPIALIILKSMHQELIEEYLKVGVKAFVRLPNDEESQNLFSEALSEIQYGDVFYDPKFIRLDINNPGRSKLTAGELRVIRMLAEGYPVKNIAEKLNRSIGTIDTQKANAMRKLNVHTLAQLVIYVLTQDKANNIL